MEGKGKGILGGGIRFSLAVSGKVGSEVGGGIVLAEFGSTEVSGLLDEELAGDSDDGSMAAEVSAV